MNNKINFDRLFGMRLIRHKRDLYCQVFINTLDELIEQNKNFDINEVNTNDDSILMKVVDSGSIRLTKWSVEAGADVNFVNKDNNYALLIAAKKGWIEIYNYLIPYTNIELQEGVEQLLQKGVLYRERKANNLIERLVEAAIVNDIDYLCGQLKESINLNEYNSNGETPLVAACNYQNEEIVKVLLNAGANPNLPEESDSLNTPLRKSLFWRNETIIRLLIEARSNISLDDIKYAKSPHNRNTQEIIELLKVNCNDSSYEYF